MFCLNKLSGALLNNITALYKRVEYSLEINDHQAKYFEVKRGVKQGCILSPTLFNIFINDLISFVQELDKGQQLTMARLALICMQTMLSLWLKMNKTYIHVQILIDREDFWCEKNEMSININKTKTLHIQNKSTVRSNFSFNCNQSTCTIEYCNKYINIYRDIL